MNWYIGQTVICLVDHCSKDGTWFQAEREYTIQAISACRCSVLLNLGYKTDAEYKCNICSETKNDGEVWHNANKFATVEDYAHANLLAQKLIKEI